MTISTSHTVQDQYKLRNLEFKGNKIKASVSEIHLINTHMIYLVSYERRVNLPAAEWQLTAGHYKNNIIDILNLSQGVFSVIITRSDVSV